MMTKRGCSDILIWGETTSLGPPVFTVLLRLDGCQYLINAVHDLNRKRWMPRATAVRMGKHLSRETGLPLKIRNLRTGKIEEVKSG